MYEWNEIVQRIVDLIDDNIESSLSLMDIALKVGYSPYYCSRQFTKITGITIRAYTAGRKLTFSANDLRNSQQKILYIAIKYGFSSQEAFSRAFKERFFVTPAIYRQFPKPIPLPGRKAVYLPHHYEKKENVIMEEKKLYQAQIKIETIPAHKFIGIREIQWNGYSDFCNSDKYDCEIVGGINQSMVDIAIAVHYGGWFYENGKKGYLYGMLMPSDYNGDIPEDMISIDIPESKYLVFYHPPFDYLRDNGKVINIVESIAWNFNPVSIGYQWNEEKCQDYQHHYPEGYGYAVLRPIKEG